MATYGKVLYNPEIDSVYSAITIFFNNPTMTKIKDVDNYSMYMSKTYCLLSNECRYLIAFVDKNNFDVGSFENLINLNWVSFQTRTLNDKHELQSHSYNPKRGGILDTTIYRNEKNEKTSVYNCDSLPIKITLLHTPKMTVNDYQDKGTIISALETYQTIVNFTD